MTQQVKDIEAQIKAKYDALELFGKVMANNEDPLLHDYIALLKQDVEFLSNQLIGLRKDSEYVSMESLDSMVSDMKERYICDCCGDLRNIIEAKDKNNNVKQWITVNGVHIPIKKGQNKDDVVSDFISKSKDDKDDKKSKGKTDKDDDLAKSKSKAKTNYDSDLKKYGIRKPTSDELKKGKKHWSDIGIKGRNLFVSQFRMPKLASMKAFDDLPPLTQAMITDKALGYALSDEFRKNKESVKYCEICGDIKKKLT